MGRFRVDLKIPIPSVISIDGYKAQVVYDGQPKTCFYCKATDHLKHKCPELRNENHNKKTPPKLLSEIVANTNKNKDMTAPLEQTTGPIPKQNTTEEYGIPAQNNANGGDSLTDKLHAAHTKQHGKGNKNETHNVAKNIMPPLTGPNKQNQQSSNLSLKDLDG